MTVSMHQQEKNPSLLADNLQVLHRLKVLQQHLKFFYLCQFTLNFLYSVMK